MDRTELSPLGRRTLNYVKSFDAARAAISAGEAALVACFSTTHPGFPHFHVYLWRELWAVAVMELEPPFSADCLLHLSVYQSAAAAMLYAETVAKALQLDAQSWDQPSCG